MNWIFDPNILTAIATAVMAAFTAVLTCVSWWQARLIRREFVATHRPRVIIRFIQGPNRGGGDIDSAIESVWVTVANVGSGEARIIEFGGDLARRNEEKKTWLEPGLAAGPKKIDTIKLKSGARHVFKVTAKKPYTDIDIMGDAVDAYELCAVGVVRYQDTIGTLRETGFFQVYDAKGERFVPSKSEEDEYQD